MESGVTATPIPRKVANVLAPITNPSKIIGVGCNYAMHNKQHDVGQDDKWVPMPLLNKTANCLVGPGKTVRYPRGCKEFDWECELTVVVGKRLTFATVEEAREAIAGLTICLDMSARDLFFNNTPLKISDVRCKMHDGLAPIGAHIMPVAFIPDYNNLRMTLEVNGKTMIDDNTSGMLYKCDEILSEISNIMTLEPGDLIFTGSPSGSANAHGNAWLKPGDQIHAEIENVTDIDVTVYEA